MNFAIGGKPFLRCGRSPGTNCLSGHFFEVFAPGLRIGYYMHRRGTEFHAACQAGDRPQLIDPGQALAAEYLGGGHLDRQLPKIIDLYRPRQEAMLKAMTDFFPEGFSWSRPTAACSYGPRDRKV